MTAHDSDDNDHEYVDNLCMRVRKCKHVDSYINNQSCLHPLTFLHAHRYIHTHTLTYI
jgi:hypothetical protein